MICPAVPATPNQAVPPDDWGDEVEDEDEDTQNHPTDHEATGSDDGHGSPHPERVMPGAIPLVKRKTPAQRTELNREVKRWHSLVHSHYVLWVPTAPMFTTWQENDEGLSGQKVQKCFV